MNNLYTKPLAITDVETTGLDPHTHEIIEIGLVVVDQKTLEIKDTLDIKVRPEKIKTAQEAALERNGYNKAEWAEAVSLKEAMKVYARKTRDAIFCAYNVSFDWPFIFESFKKTGVKNEMDYRRICIMSIAWEKLRGSGIERINLEEVSRFLGLPPEPWPHRALEGAKTEYQILKKLLTT